MTEMTLQSLERELQVIIDTTTEFGKRAKNRLENEPIGWLTTVTPSGQPKATPIWFLWQEDQQTLLMYSQPNTMKLRNIGANPRVSFNFNADPHGNNVVRLEGRAEVASDVPKATDVPAFIDKYREAIPTVPTTPEGFAAEYSVAIVLRPERLTGF